MQRDERRNSSMGESLEVRRHNQPVAIISPLQASKALRKRPNFRGRLQSIYGDHVLPQTATALLSEDRGAR